MFNEYICHYGVSGQKWGVRRYENEDGTLTDEGLKRYRYTKSDQRKDKKMFSKGAVKRIEKKLKNGETIESARGAEVERLHKTRSKALTAGILGAAFGAAFGMKMGLLAPDMLQKGALALTSTGRFPEIMDKQFVLYRDSVKKALIAGGVAIGAGAGYKVARNNTMRVNGYKARRYRG